MTDSPQDKSNISRRDFGKAGVYAFFGTVGVGTAGLLRSVLPSALPDPSQEFKIGPPQDYPEGTVREFPEENVIVFREREGMWAISTVCTHLGCIVAYDSEKKKFDCACHGSKFDDIGGVTQGPAPRPLDWIEIAMLPSGQLVVDRARSVPMGTKFPV